MPKLLIGLTGPARSGKDTVAGFLEGFGFYRVAFADPIRAGLAAMLDVPRWQLFTGGMKERPISPHWPAHITPRTLMQTLGTEWGRDTIDPDFWLRIAADKWFACGKSMVISDVRFESEAAWVRSQGGQVWHITRPNRPEIGGVEGHRSEAGVAVVDGDVLLENTGSVDALGYSVRLRVQELKQAGLL